MSTAGQLLVNSLLPEDLRDNNRVLDGPGIKSLLREVAERYPGKYREISHAMSVMGYKAAQETGGLSFGMQHIRKSNIARQMQQQMQPKLAIILNDDRLTDQQRNDAIVRLVGSQKKPMEDAIYKEALASGNPLADQVRSKARGSPANLASILGGDMLYTDNRDNIIPIPVFSSYSEGLKPWELFAGSYGARKGVVDVKLATARSGALSKQLNQVSHRQVVTDLDAAEGDENVRGLPADINDADNEGALLAQDTGPYKRNAVITPKIQAHLRQLGHKRLLVRSPSVGGPSNGGVYSRDVGIREHGNLPGRGENPGFTAAQALSEPINQAQLSSKHSGGVAGEGKGVSGFAAINQLVQVPKQFKGGAAHSQEDGVVGKITDAPAGGKYVHVNGVEHHVPIGDSPTVSQGDIVEAGDMLSDGLPNPAEIVKHKGIGEGRRYFALAYRDAMCGAGLTAHRRNIELLGKGLINHVRLTKEHGDFVPDDIVPYHEIENSWQPREGAQDLPPALARGKYLEKPVLHHTIGTKIRPSVQRDLKEFGVKSVTVHGDPPPFEPEMIRGMANLSHDSDWLTRMHGSGIKDSVLDAAHHGAVSDEKGTSFVPSIARAVDFGRIPGAAVRKPEKPWEINKTAAAVPDGRALATGVNPATTPAVHPGGGAAPTSTPTPSALPSAASKPPASPTPPLAPTTPAPPAQPAAPAAPVQPAAPAPPATPEESGSSGDYMGDGMSSLARMALPYASSMGPLGPLAVMASLPGQWGNIGKLTHGPGQFDSAAYRQNLIPGASGADFQAPSQPSAPTTPSAPMPSEPQAQVDPRTQTQGLSRPVLPSMNYQPLTDQPTSLSVDPRQQELANEAAQRSPLDVGDANTVAQAAPPDSAGAIGRAGQIAGLGAFAAPLGYNVGAGAYNTLAGAIPGEPSLPYFTESTPGMIGQAAGALNKSFPLLNEAALWKNDPKQYEANGANNWASRGMLTAMMRGNPLSALAGMGHDIVQDARQDYGAGGAGTWEHGRREAARTEPGRISANPFVEYPAAVRAAGKLTPTGTSGVDATASIANPAWNQVNVNQDPRLAQSQQEAKGYVTARMGQDYVNKRTAYLARMQQIDPANNWQINWSHPDPTSGEYGMIYNAGPKHAQPAFTSDQYGNYPMPHVGSGGAGQ